ncbi:F0F1 ATP synthase subunit delta [Acidipropionibacterium timonense]|uniref:F0F1 ATP synthase subunit delta n=1 Tax=Acidipropionibacterium timonense TaxID=2161818 RepID=UPI001031A422|nr:F0F1 ATP synthase subunit delta [Acidipropionibacterium timonense]
MSQQMDPAASTASGELTSKAADLDGLLDRTRASTSLADDLFQVVDLLGANSALRRAVTDPGTPVEARRGLVHHLLDGRLGHDALAIVDDAVGRRWASAGSMPRALERQGVRAVLLQAQASEHLDDVEDELFRFRRTVAGDPQLQVAIGGHERSLSDRMGLVAGLLAGRVQEESTILACRAVRAMDRTFDGTMAGYLDLAAQLRGRALAVVTTARSLTDQQRQQMREQIERITGRTVTLQEVVDPRVLGGAKVEVGDEVIDGTVASRLDQAKRELG